MNELSINKYWVSTARRLDGYRESLVGKSKLETLTGDHWKIHVGDVMDGLAAIPSGSVHCVVTSPPYWGLRDYGFEGQIGSEKTPEEFVATMIRVFGEVRRTLRDDGLVFLNLGDSHANDTKWGGSTSGKHRKGLLGTTGIGRCRTNTDLAPGNVVGIPWRVAFALQAGGWILRKDIVWFKPSPMPESVSGSRWVRCRKKVAVGQYADQTHPESYKGNATQNGKANRHCIGGEWIGGPEWVYCSGCRTCEPNEGYVLRQGSWRPTTSHEMIFMFAKSSRYFADGDTSKEPATGTAHARGNGVNPKAASIELTSSRNGQSKQNGSFSAAVHQIVETRNLRSVWKITSESYKEAHFATFPTELVRRCLSAAISSGGCCSECGNQWAPIVEGKRTATRPGTNSKVNRAAIHEDSPYHSHSGMAVGNRDPQRHTTTTLVTGYRPTCKCNAAAGRPIVLDCFSGSATTGQVAINIGCEYIGIEGNPAYAELGVKRLETPWVPVAERRAKPKGKSRRRHKRQAELF